MNWGRVAPPPLQSAHLKLPVRSRNAFLYRTNRHLSLTFTIQAERGVGFTSKRRFFRQTISRNFTACAIFSHDFLLVPFNFSVCITLSSSRARISRLNIGNFNLSVGRKSFYKDAIRVILVVKSFSGRSSISNF